MTLAPVSPSRIAQRDVELLARILAPRDPGPRWQRVARRMLALHGGLAGLNRRVADADAFALDAVEQRAQRRVEAALELGRRVGRAAIGPGTYVRHAADLHEHLLGWIGARRKECFVVVLLDAKHRVLGSERVSEGCLTWSVVHPREVFAPAVRASAAAIVVAHNHPSGDPTPSPEDREVTSRLVRAGLTLGIPLLDHIVVGQGRCVSLREACWDSVSAAADEEPALNETSEVALPDEPRPEPRGQPKAAQEDAAELGRNGGSARGRPPV